ncbi:phytanoyl-CoA dioxygenase family protein [Candidatus Parabeggiatoa sp. HSG14]|uniref:phytanoyl-CoA dioxygenase family protein n=1 Tax=Candidatus Parabeggiatoa sp. HSG14 TaxID=3055593 RepID=UPI0025A71321|nr:phytanoyl-CoA dioxygenase family protein [Thiotrichales bacterium HSG14]
MKHEYNKNGFYLIEKALNESEVKSLIDKLRVFEENSNNYGVRDLMNKVPYIRHLALSSPLLPIAKEVLGDFAKPVRTIFFDKVPDANWNVPWHQDTSIAVKEKVDIVGFEPWTEKQGIVHVEPPEEFLASILTLRVHLDVTNSENGVLRVIPGTHKNGRIKSKALMNIVKNSKSLECKAEPGDILLMCPLLFHSSRKALKPKHRRVIHIEYSALELPKPLKWYEFF